MSIARALLMAGLLAVVDSCGPPARGGRLLRPARWRRWRSACWSRWHWLPASVWVAEVQAAEAEGRASVYLERLEAVGRLCERLPCGAPDWLRVVG